MHGPHIWMESSADRHFNPAIKKYVEILMQRVLPIFSDPDAEQERASREALDSLGSWAGADCDYGSLMEHAYHEGIEQALMLLEMRSVFLATSVAGLFHLFEKQLYAHLKNEFRNIEFTKGKKVFEINSWANADEIIRQFSYVTECTGTTLIQAIDNPDLQELREVANAVKHGEGRAAKALADMKAPVVDPVRVGKDGMCGRFSILNVSLSITQADVLRYERSILDFWAVRGRFSEPNQEA